MLSLLCLLVLPFCDWRPVVVASMSSWVPASHKRGSSFFIVLQSHGEGGSAAGGVPRMWRGRGGVVAALHVVLLTVAPGQARGAS